VKANLQYAAILEKIAPLEGEKDKLVKYGQMSAVIYENHICKLQKFEQGRETDGQTIERIEIG
jgi:hypothetical protein